MKLKLFLLLALAAIVAGCKDANCYECELRYQSNNNKVPDTVWPGTYVNGCDDTTESYLKANPIYITDGSGNIIHDYYWSCK